MFLKISNHTPLQLSDDLLGGGTVFPEWGLSAVPRLGSAVFWLNQTPDGQRNYRSLHSGCPTISGVKWGE